MSEVDFLDLKMSNRVYCQMEICPYVVIFQRLACLSQETEALVIDTEQHNGARSGSGCQGDGVTGFSR